MKIKFIKIHQNIIDICKNLKKSQEWLAAQDIDTLIQLISLARNEWMREDHELYKFRKRELDFLISWTEPSNLKQLADRHRCQRGFLDNFRPMNNSVRRLLRAQPRGIVGHWLSGNVPILGL